MRRRVRSGASGIDLIPVLVANSQSQLDRLLFLMNQHRPGDLLESRWQDWAVAQAFAARELAREVDLVLLATGYRITFPFLDDLSPLNWQVAHDAPRPTVDDRDPHAEPEQLGDHLARIRPGAAGSRRRSVTCSRGARARRRGPGLRGRQRRHRLEHVDDTVAHTTGPADLAGPPNSTGDLTP